MDIEYYERTMQKALEAHAIVAGLKDTEAGRVVDGDTALRNARDKYGV